MADELPTDQIARIEERLESLTGGRHTKGQWRSVQLPMFPATSFILNVQTQKILWEAHYGSGVDTMAALAMVPEDLRDLLAEVKRLRGIPERERCPR